MDELWRRLPTWADWAISSVVAVVLVNVNVTSAGAPLSGVGLSAGASSAGITEGGRVAFYAVLVIGGLVLTAAGLVGAGSEARHRTTRRLLVTTYPWVSLAGVLGLLLDYRDGPVATVQMVSYLMIVVGAIRLARIAAHARAHDADEKQLARW